MLLCKHERNTTSALALEDSTVAALPLDIMAELIEMHHSITDYFITILATTLGETDNRFVTITQKHIRGRLAETILALKANYGIENDDKTLNVIMNRYDLASLSNMSTSNAIRTLSSFASETVEVKDVKGCFILPGVIDDHVHHTFLSRITGPSKLPPYHLFFLIIRCLLKFWFKLNTPIRHPLHRLLESHIQVSHHQVNHIP